MSSGPVVEAILRSMEGAVCTRAKLGYGTFFTCLFERDSVETSFLWVYMSSWELRCPTTHDVLVWDEDVADDPAHVGKVLRERLEGGRVVSVELKPCSFRWRSATTNLETDLLVMPFVSRAEDEDELALWYMGDLVYTVHPSGLVSIDGAKTAR